MLLIIEFWTLNILFCFVEYHEWLLSDAVDILPFLLLPLAGPDELSEEENEGAGFIFHV